eukprot:6203008-Pleurochrysis_carterae.AAC.1
MSYAYNVLLTSFMSTRNYQLHYRQGHKVVYSQRNASQPASTPMIGLVQCHLNLTRTLPDAQKGL